MANTSETSENKKKKSPRKDRSNGKYSEEAFLALSHNEQFSLAEQYWLGQVKDFDDGTFQFSRDKFISLCESLGFRKGIIDTNAKATAYDKIYLNQGPRPETIERKFTLSKETNTVIDEYLSPLDPKREKSKRSKIVDAVINRAFTELLIAQHNGQTTVAYRPVEEEPIL